MRRLTQLERRVLTYPTATPSEEIARLERTTVEAVRAAQERLGRAEPPAPAQDVDSSPS